MAQQEYQDDDGNLVYPDDPYQPPPAFDPGPPWGTGAISDILDTYPPPPGPSPGGTIDPGPTQNPVPSSGGGGGNPYAPSGGGTSGGSSTPANFTVSSSWPTFTPPPLPTIDPMVAPPPFSYADYAAPMPFSFDPYEAPKDFSYDPFAAPTIDQAAAEPGYEFARKEGQRALENSASARGVARTGGTLKDFIGWGNKFAEQNYGNVYNRAANTYGLNRGNAFQTWGANEQARAQSYDRNRENAFGTWTGNELARQNAYTLDRGNAFENYKTNYDINRDVFGTNKGTALDLYDRAFQGAQAEFQPRFQAATATFDDIYRRQRDALNSLTTVAGYGQG